MVCELAEDYLSTHTWILKSRIFQLKTQAVNMETIKNTLQGSSGKDSQFEKGMFWTSEHSYLSSDGAPISSEHHLVSFSFKNSVPFPLRA